MRDAGIVVAKVVCGQDTFDVVLGDKAARCYMNGVAVMASKDLNSFGPIVGMAVVSSLKTPNAVLSIKGNQTYADFLNGLLDTITKSDQIRVEVLKYKPDEIADQKPKQAYRLSDSDLEEYKESIRVSSGCLNDVLSLGDILLKTKLPKNAMAFKEINSILSKVRAASTELEKNIEHCELMVERTGTYLGRVMIARNCNLNDPQVKKAVQESIDHVAADFMAMKKLMAFLIMSHYPLYSIDPVMKKYTDYPATWFFDPSVFYNFSERYKDASDNLIDAVRTEASTIQPLYAWKMKVTE
jgi:hypothetical protein